MQILVFDKFLGYNIGGAQRSLHALLDGIRMDGSEFTYLGCDVKHSFNANNFKVKNFEVERFKIFELPKLPYYEYLINRPNIKNVILNNKSDILITQGLWGAVAARYFSKKVIYFIRDEYQLNRIPIYYNSLFKKLLKYLYIFIQLPAIVVLFWDNFKAIQKADVVVANSEFIQREIEKNFYKKSLLVYPLVDKFNSILGKNNNKSDKYIVSIGSEYMKGRKIVEEIAQKMPNEKFIIVGREFKNITEINNISYYPWQSDVKNIYQKAKLVLIPSICQEAFCRVALEAQLIGLPVVGSNRGGISEVINSKYLINNIFDINYWVELINKVNREQIFGSYSFYDHSHKFDFQKQVDSFKKILQDLQSS